jgi:enoyl-CoA hydratase
MTHTQEVLFETIDNIAVITLNRPAQRNAINRALHHGLLNAWEQFEKEPALQVAILLRWYGFKRIGRKSVRCASS